MSSVPFSQNHSNKIFIRSYFTFYLWEVTFRSNYKIGKKPQIKFNSQTKRINRSCWIRAPLANKDYSKKHFEERFFVTTIQFNFGQNLLFNKLKDTFPIFLYFLAKYFINFGSSVSFDKATEVKLLTSEKIQY